MTPVILGLRVHIRVAVNFRGRGLQNFRFHPLGEAQHVDRAVHARLGCLHRIVLIVDGRSRTGEIVDLVDLKIDRECHIVANELKAFVIEQMLDVATHASEEIVETNDLRTFFQQPFAQMRAEKPGSTCHQNTLLKMHQPPSSRPKRIDAISRRTNSKSLSTISDTSCVERHLVPPAEFLSSLRGIANEKINLCRSKIAWVDFNEHLV